VLQDKKHKTEKHLLAAADQGSTLQAVAGPRSCLLTRVNRQLLHTLQHTIAI
jgi:hypothetical protein